MNLAREVEPAATEISKGKVLETYLITIRMH